MLAICNSYCMYSSIYILRVSGCVPIGGIYSLHDVYRSHNRQCLGWSANVFALSLSSPGASRTTSPTTYIYSPRSAVNRTLLHTSLNLHNTIRAFNRCSDCIKWLNKHPSRRRRHGMGKLYPIIYGWFTLYAQHISRTPILCYICCIGQVFLPSHTHKHSPQA